MISYITGSGFYEYEGFAREAVDTRYGQAELLSGSIGGTAVLILPRHGPEHRNLPHHINHRANLVALKEAGATAVVSCSVCGVVNPDWEIGKPLLATDVHFPENRLGDGSACTLFDTPGEAGRGHLLASSLLNRPLAEAIKAAWEQGEVAPEQGVYAHVAGPRFNTQTEIRQLRTCGVDFISQTCGPEAVLANELELPYALAAFGIDFANGTRAEPTPVETLNENLQRSKTAFTHLIESLAEPESGFGFTNFVYRF